MGILVFKNENNCEPSLEREYFEAFPLGFAVFEVHDDGRVLFADINAAFESVTGLRREALLGHTFDDVVPGGGFDWPGALTDVARTGEVSAIEEYLDKPVRRWVRARVYRVRPGVVAAIFEDINHEMRVEQALRRQRSND